MPRICFVNYNNFDTKTYEMNEVSVENFINCIKEVADHSEYYYLSEDLEEIIEALNELKEEPDFTLEDMLETFNDVTEDGADVFMAYEYDKSPLIDDDEVTFEFRTDGGRYSVEDQEFKVKNIKTDAFTAFKNAMKTWLENLRYDNESIEFMEDDEDTVKKYKDYLTNGIKKFTEYLEGDEFREMLMPSDEEFYDKPNMAMLIRIWNNCYDPQSTLEDMTEIEMWIAGWDSNNQMIEIV